MLTLWRGLLQLLLPTRCVICQQLGREALCGTCASGLEAVGGLHCARCGRRRETAFASPDCAECYGESLGVERARSLYIYNAAGRALLAEFKYRQRIGAGLALSDHLRDWLAQGIGRVYGLPELACDIVVPVPLHKSRIHKRRFNQAALIARRVAQGLGLPCLPQVLLRLRETPSQVGLSANQRQLNVRGAFAVPEAQRAALAGKRVLLIDDLMTTGATLAACARALRKGGSPAVYGLTLFSTHYSTEAEADGVGKMAVTRV